jgi:hypothetical protein
MGAMSFVCLFMLGDSVDAAISLVLLLAGVALIGGAIFHVFRLWGLVICGFILIGLLLFIATRPHIIG